MDLVELYRSIEEGEFDPVIDSETINFYYESNRYGVIPSPRPAGEHYTENRTNFTYPRKPNANERTHQEKLGVPEAMETGWIIPAPHEMYVKEDSNGNLTPYTHRPEYIADYQTQINTELNEHVLYMNTYCIVDVPEGYSILVISPCNYVESRFTVIPRMVDAGEFPQRLQVPIRVHSEEFRMDPGTPLVQIVPINHTDTGIEATVGTFSRTAHSNGDTEPEHINKEL